MVTAVLHEAGLPATTTWMVGDSAEDRRAAASNGLRFFAAAWGYGAEAASDTDRRTDALTDPLALLAAVEGRC
jgi:phosphoglycolate phosphatase-like HAD superfamily hydrolase